MTRLSIQIALSPWRVSMGIKAMLITVKVIAVSAHTADNPKHTNDSPHSRRAGSHALLLYTGGKFNSKTELMGEGKDL